MVIREQNGLLSFNVKGGLCEVVIVVVVVVMVVVMLLVMAFHLVFQHIYRQDLNTRA